MSFNLYNCFRYFRLGGIESPNIDMSGPIALKKRWAVCLAKSEIKQRNKAL